MKHIFADMDGTVCESREKISTTMLEALTHLKHDLVIISGAERERMKVQLLGLDCYIMAQSGNDTHLWKKNLTENNKKKILAHIKKIVEVKEDMIDDRGCQISLSFVGHHAPIELKKTFDPIGQTRIKLLKEKPFINNMLECRVAGTTCLDYTRKDGMKGKNIGKFIKQMGWDKKECIYFGDKLYKGGNDESVVGVIEVVPVKNPQDLLEKLKNYDSRWV
jgi:phosphomannomutase